MRPRVRRKLVVDGRRYVVEIGYSMLLKSLAGEILGCLRNRATSGFICIPSPQRGQKWEPAADLRAAVRSIVRRLRTEKAVKEAYRLIFGRTKSK